MATYCISDIHGHYREFRKLLKKIGFSEQGDDTLWILGDIIDRGSESFQMLQYAIECSNGRHGDVRFLMGNHEYMMYETLERKDDDFVLKRTDSWPGNGGLETAAEIRRKKPPGWIRRQLIPWLDQLPLCAVADVGGTEWMLVHAGFDPANYGTTFADGISGIFVGNGFGVQDPWEMMWAREEWMLDYYDAPMPTVHGHTMTTLIKRELGIFEDSIQATAYCDDGILFYLNKVDIDCGAGMGDRLGCLRLDDLEEFYVPIRNPLLAKMFKNEHAFEY